MNPYYYIEHRSLLFVQKRAVIPVNLAKLMYISHNNILWYYTGVSILHWNLFPGFQSTIQYVNTGSNNRLAPNRHLTRCVARYYRVPTYIAKTLGSTSIRYRSYTFASGLIDIVRWSLLSGYNDCTEYSTNTYGLNVSPWIPPYTPASTNVTRPLEELVLKQAFIM